MNTNELRPYKVYSIKEGVVVDHIPAFDSLKIIKLLNLTNGTCDNKSIVTVGMNMESKKQIRKDVLKIENKALTKDELNKISLIADNATVSLIKNHKVKEKLKIIIPKVVEDIIKCGNENCITNHQPIKTCFTKIQKTPLKMKCTHCEKVFSKEELLIK